MSLLVVTRNISANSAAPMGLRHAEDEHIFDTHIGKYVVSPRNDAKNYALATLPDGSERAASEYEDCSRLAREHNVPLQRVMQAAQSAALRFE